MTAAVFLDRDNTIIHNDGDLGDPDQVKLIKGAATAIASLCGLGYSVFVVTNQGGVARGKYTEDDVQVTHERLHELVRAQANGARIDGFYYCPYHPQGSVPEYTREHEDRKPQPGMLLRAAKEHGIDLAASWMVGDAERDAEAGRAAGCRTILIDPKAKPIDKPRPGDGSEAGGVPDFLAPSLIDAVRLIAQQRAPEPGDLSNPKPGEARRWDKSKVAQLQRVDESDAREGDEYGGEIKKPQKAARPFRPWNAPVPLDEQGEPLKLGRGGRMSRRPVISETETVTAAKQTTGLTGAAKRADAIDVNAVPRVTNTASPSTSTSTSTSTSASTSASTSTSALASTSASITALAEHQPDVDADHDGDGDGHNDGEGVPGDGVIATVKRGSVQARPKANLSEAIPGEAASSKTVPKPMQADDRDAEEHATELKADLPSTTAEPVVPASVSVPEPVRRRRLRGIAQPERALARAAKAIDTQSSRPPQGEMSTSTSTSKPTSKPASKPTSTSTSATTPAAANATKTTSAHPVGVPEMVIQTPSFTPISPLSMPGTTGKSAPTPDSTEQTRLLKQVLAELRTQRGGGDDFTVWRMAGIALQALAIVSVLAALWLGAGDAEVFNRWMAAALIAQGAMIAALLFDR